MTATRRQVEPGIWLDARRALWLEATGSLVVADLHWGYAASHRAAGNLLPTWGDSEMAATLDALLADYRPREMIWLGDTIHAAAGRNQAEAFLRRLTLPVLVVRGNHDRAWRHPTVLPGLERDGFVLHHGDGPLAAGPGRRELIGHYHPAALWGDSAGASVKLPALLSGPRRWIMPAYSPWAAGVVWNHKVEPDETLWAISPRRIVPLRNQPRSEHSRV